MLVEFSSRRRFRVHLIGVQRIKARERNEGVNVNCSHLILANFFFGIEHTICPLPPGNYCTLELVFFFPDFFAVLVSTSYLILFEDIVLSVQFYFLSISYNHRGKYFAGGFS